MRLVANLVVQFRLWSFLISSSVGCDAVLVITRTLDRSTNLKRNSTLRTYMILDLDPHSSICIERLYLPFWDWG